MSLTLAVVSDIHFAGAAERARADFEFAGIPNPLVRFAMRTFRHWVWLREPLNQGAQFERFLREAPIADAVVANGDFSCDSGFVGVCDEAAFASAKECLEKLRAKFGARLHATIGDHELGKVSMGGGLGGMRLASYERATNGLGLRRFWKTELGSHVLMGVTSSLVALPVFEHDILESERGAWEKLRGEHLAEIRAAFAALRPEQRVILFCHDPTALAFLWREEIVRAKLPQVEQTIIGHLHTKLVLWKSRLLAGMPVIRFLGHTPRRMTTALNEARHWKKFNVRLCPSLSGTELLKDGGFLTAELDAEAKTPARFTFHRMRR